MFAGVQQLRGGEYLSIDLAAWRPGGVPAPRRWYELPRPDSLALPMETAL